MSEVRIDDLNPAQRAAVVAGDGPILILAGAGSGKTRVLTYRIAYMLHQRKLTADQILAVTFTNKAANEMRERLGLLLGPGSRQPWISTFHSACARILRSEIEALGYRREFTILDEADVLSLLRRVIEQAASSQSPTPEIARARIDQAKNEGLNPDDLAERATSAGDSTIAAIYRRYQQSLREINALDFGDLLMMALELFRHHPEVGRKWRSRLTHLLVDEYQDTNRVQYLLLRELSSESGNLCVVGDEDQSIYRWRGADIRNILEFERDFPNAQVFKLEQNYRSTKTILAAADAVISNNSERKLKRLWTENEAGEQITCYTGLTERDEADWIAREIGRLTAAGDLSPADLVIFYRTNAQSRVIEEALVRRRVPYYVAGGLRFYEHREIKDLLAYLRAIANPRDSLSLERLIAVPPRGVGLRTVESLRQCAAREGLDLFGAMARAEVESNIALRIAKQVSALHAWLSALSAKVTEMTVRSLLDEILLQTNFHNYLDGLEDGQSRRENVAELLSAAANFDNESGPGHLSDFLERVALVSDADRIDADGGRVALMTLHTSKGLEYPVVFIAGMEEGLFPHNRSQDSHAEVEEERRLCYVGMTRARRLLYLTNTLTREIYGRREESRPSRFIAEIDPSLLRRIAPPELSTGGIRIPSSREPYIDYSETQLAPDEAEAGAGVAVGMRVAHPTFGPGVVRRREGRGEGAKAWIQFERGGMKLLVLKFAQLRPIAD